jgi:hypothetical protein
MRPAGSFLNECWKQRLSFSVDKDDSVTTVFNFAAAEGLCEDGEFQAGQTVAIKRKKRRR